MNKKVKTIYFSILLLTSISLYSSLCSVNYLKASVFNETRERFIYCFQQIVDLSEEPADSERVVRCLEKITVGNTVDSQELCEAIDQAYDLVEKQHEKIVSDVELSMLISEIAFCADTLSEIVQEQEFEGEDKVTRRKKKKNCYAEHLLAKELEVKGSTKLKGSLYVQASSCQNQSVIIDCPTTFNNSVSVNNDLIVNGSFKALRAGTFAHLKVTDSLQIGPDNKPFFIIDKNIATSALPVVVTGESVSRLAEEEKTKKTKAPVVSKFIVDINGNLSADGTLAVAGNTQLGGSLNVTGAATINGLLTAKNGAIITGNITGSQGASFGNGNFTVNSTGNITSAGTLAVAGNTQLGGSLNVTGAVIANGLLTANNGAVITGNITGSQGASFGNITTAGTLAAAGNTQLGGSLNVTGAVIANGLLTAKNGAVITGSLTGTNANFAGALTANSITTNSITDLGGLTVNSLVVANNFTGNTAALSSTFSAANGAFFVDSVGGVTVTSIRSTSTRKSKNNIEKLMPSSDSLLKVNAVTFDYKNDPEHKMHYGFIAEEIEALYPALVSRNQKGEAIAVNYVEFTPVLLHEIQKQHKMINACLSRIESLEKIIDKTIN